VASGTYLAVMVMIGGTIKPPSDNEGKVSVGVRRSSPNRWFDCKHT